MYEKVLWTFKKTSEKYNWFWKEKSTTLTTGELKSHQDGRNCYIWGRRILTKISESINYQKFWHYCHCTGKYRGAVHSICNLTINVPNEISVVFHKGSNYDYHFIIKELANEFETKFGCLEENTQKYKTFSVPIATEVIKTDKDGDESVLTISYKIRFIGSVRFMATSLSSPVHKIKYKDCDFFSSIWKCQIKLNKIQMFILQ